MDLGTLSANSFYFNKFMLVTNLVR